MASPFIISRPDGTERRVSGYRYAAPRPGTKLYSAAKSAIDRLPPKVDLRPQMTAVENQGETSSCVANAVAGAYEYLVKQHLGEDAYDVSRLFIYYNARRASGCEGEDGGSIISDAISGLREHGACSEETWPFDEGAVLDEPHGEAYEEASQFLVEDVLQVPTTLEAWRTCLAEGSPIVFGISLFNSFDNHRKKGLVPLPTNKETARESHSGHAMLCVGYSDPDKLFIVRNSWGTDWGDGGYCYIPYSYLLNSKFNDGDSWIIRRLENVDFDQGTWGDDTSIVGELDTELAAMDEDAYREMLDAMGDVPLESRLALIFLHGAGADGDLTDEELQGVAGYMETVLEQLGSRYNAEKVLRKAIKRLDDEALLQESVELLGQHLPKSALAGITTHLQEVAGGDGLSDEEESFVNDLIEAWQIAEGDEGEDESEDEGEGEGEGEDEEDEGDDEGDDEEDEGDDEEEDEEEEDE
jgi:C1A family cysteine protease